MISAPVFSQDSNIAYPIAKIEEMITSPDAEIAIPRSIRINGDNAKFAVLKRYRDGFFINIKIKKSAKGGEALNNQPRYEIAAYQFQKMFLDPDEYVVPPTLGRGFTPDEFSNIEQDADPTFKNTRMIFCDIQYWLNNVTKKDVYDKKRFKNNLTYAKHVGNLNILTFLIRHSDSNEGNFLISKDPENPRVFAVDNGLAFGDAHSQRGYDWLEIRVDRLPAKTIDRLRKITTEDLEAKLLVVSQFRIEDGLLIPEPPSAAIDKLKGVRLTKNTLQLGLTQKEIQNIYWRIEELLKKIDKGTIKTF